MRAFRNLSIKWKLNLITATVTSIVLLLTGIGSFHYYERNIRERAVNELDSMAQVLAISVDSSLIFDDPETAYQVLSSLKAVDGIIFACIHDNMGTVFAKYIRDNDRPPCIDQKLSGTVALFEKNQLLLSRQIILNNSILGTLYIQKSLEKVNSHLRKALLAYIAMIITLFVLAVLLTYPLQRMISRPIILLTKTVKEITRDKNYSIRFLSSSDDEVGELINSFNEMISEVKLRDESLERKVAQRTDDLQLALNKLQEEISERKELEEERTKIIEKLQKALDEIKTLRGIIPICSSCKKIRDDKGSWSQVESYIRKHSEAEFSYGLCPDCVIALYPDLIVK